MTNPLPAIDAALKTLNREIWIVTAATGERRGGLVATWVQPASIDNVRPVMLAGIAPNHFTCELIQASGAVGLHLLRRDQLATAFHFAIGSGRTRDKLADIAHRLGQTGAPLLDDCAVWMEGRVFHQMSAGDRIFFWIDILAAGHTSPGPHAREQDLFAAATPEQKRLLLADRDADIALQRPMHEAWRASL